MLYFYNENFFASKRTKNFIKKLLGRDYRGPTAVEESLKRGLAGLNISYEFNRPFSGTLPPVCVLSGILTLQWALKEKQSGRIKTLVAGPTVALPRDKGGIIFHEDIDIFLVPSPWVADFCESFCPGFKKRIRVWAAGVKTEPLTTRANSRHGCLVYKKKVEPVIFTRTLNILKSRGIDYTILEYGNYKRDEYYKLLGQSKLMVYFSDSESQGMALHEAWMMDVPTLVYNGGYLRQSGYEFKHSSPAPYLTPACGTFFSSIESLPGALDYFMASSTVFDPRKYHLENFTDEICAQKFLTIIQQQNFKA